MSQPLGDPDDPSGFGSSEICDMGPEPTPFGGVPAVNPPDFGPGQMITDAIQDMQCRFSVQEASNVACTRNRFGDFAYLDPATRRQFCFQVPLSAQFQVGDTVMAIQLRDLAGNLGPKKEIVIRVGP